jgi:hypothetical protein
VPWCASPGGETGTFHDREDLLRAIPYKTFRDHGKPRFNLPNLSGFPDLPGLTGLCGLLPLFRLSAFRRAAPDKYSTGQGSAGQVQRRISTAPDKYTAG